jgi:hypothetical protein
MTLLYALGLYNTDFIQERLKERELSKTPHIQLFGNFMGW